MKPLHIMAPALIVAGAALMVMVLRPAVKSKTASSRSTSTKVLRQEFHGNTSRTQSRPRAAVSSPDPSPVLANASTQHPVGNRIRAAMKAGDWETTVIEQMRAELRSNPPRAGRALLDAFRTETDPTVLIILANLLGENPDVMLADEAIQALVALTESELPAKRRAALAALSFAQQLTPDLINRITEISREDPSNDVRISAIATMSVWMGRKPETVTPLSQELVVTARASDDTAVRGHAIQLIANQGQKMPDNVVAELQNYLSTEKSPQNRQLAAYGLGSATGGARAGALDQLQQAYNRETDMDTRRVILMQIVRIGQEDAPAILKTLTAENTLLQNDIKDYQALLAEGVRSADEIWTRKSLKDADRGTEIGMLSSTGAVQN